jgi:hypothetical protein
MIILTKNNIDSVGVDFRILNKTSQTIYRGDESPIPIENFDPEYGVREQGKQLGTSMGEGPGIYFTDNKDNAENYGSHISVYIISNNANLISSSSPKFNYRQIEKIINAIPQDIVDIAASNWDENIQKGKRILIKTILDGNNAIDQLMGIWAEVINRQDPKMFMDIMKNFGVDGIKIDRGDYINYAIYNPDVLSTYNQYFNAEYEPLYN